MRLHAVWASCFALALSLAACSGFDCDFPDYEYVEDTLVLRAQPDPSDTLTVVFELGRVEADFGIVGVSDGARRSQPSATDQTELVLEAEFGNYEAQRVPPLAAEAVGDTLYVVAVAGAEGIASAPACAKRDGVVQPVCSPRAARLHVRVLGVNAPGSTREVQYFMRDSSGVLAAVHAAPTPVVSTARTVRG